MIFFGSHNFRLTVCCIYDDYLLFILVHYTCRVLAGLLTNLLAIRPLHWIGGPLPHLMISPTNSAGGRNGVSGLGRYERNALCGV